MATLPSLLLVLVDFIPHRAREVGSVKYSELIVVRGVVLIPKQQPRGNRGGVYAQAGGLAHVLPHHLGGEKGDLGPYLVRILRS